MVQPLPQTTLLPSSLQHNQHRDSIHSNHHVRSSGAKICTGATISLVNLTGSMMLLISSLLLTPQPFSGTGVAGLSCSSCDRSMCPSQEKCPGGITLDICDCCHVCARVKDEKCGGQFGIFGQCDRGLHCFIWTEDGKPITGIEPGVCKGQELLCNENCPPVYEPKLCPLDSFLTTSNKQQRGHNISKQDTNNIDSTNDDNYDSSENNVIPHSYQTSYCLCNVSVCEMPDCASGYTIQLIRLGNGVPGSCCSTYVCRKSQGCQSVICPPYEEELCPADSVRISSEWTADGCCEIHQGCTCKLGDQCEPVRCREGFQLEIISRATKLPGSCCDRFRCQKERRLPCSYKGKYLESGQAWQTDNCKICECRDGLTKCKHKACQNLSCTWMVIPEGECCPVCRGCVSDSGNLYNDSAVWQENDCTTCTCRDGQAHCQSEMCSVQCANPQNVPGQCCPGCPDDEHPAVSSMCSNSENCSTICKHGLEQTQEGCFLCQCRKENCHLDCTFGLKTDLEGNIVCECKGAEDKCPPWEDKQCGKKCEYGYKQTRDGCFRCKCRKCPQFNCPKRCVHGHVLNDDGCPLCKCKEMAAPELTGFNYEPDNRDGKSCLTWHGSRHENGESWNDGCRLCYCHNGAEMCSLIACPIPHCSNPLFRTGDCCPTCPGHTVVSAGRGNEMCESSQGQHYVEGQLWMMDLCTQCICHKGTILCETPSCPPVVCHHPIKSEKQCCAICRGSDSLPAPSHLYRNHRCMSPTGIFYKHDEIWRSTPCQSCVCRNGQIDCYNQICPPLNCNRVVQRKGFCCPTCVETGQAKICTNGGVTYSTGEKWEGDNCTECSCYNGQTICSPLTCPHLECTILIRKINQCCPECSDHAQLQSHIHRSIGLYKDNLPNNTASSNSKSGVDGNIVGIAVLGIMVFILAIIIFLLIIYLMIWRHLSNLRQKPKSTSLKRHGQLPFGKPVISEKEYFTQHSLDVASEKEKMDRTSNVYTEMIFRDQTKDSFEDQNKHLLKII